MEFARKIEGSKMGGSYYGISGGDVIGSPLGESLSLYGGTGEVPTMGY